jgi:pimeloyl-ACP methyl ester carboxylesterase
MIYIHGFLGTETSFQSFPAHVHALLTPALAQTHVVYTKIYPRYKSRNKISVARDDFSNWLAPHETPETDIILIGHSLGGILAAEVILLPSSQNVHNDNLFRHRVLGLIAFDTPFLGLHPGVISTGIASLFRTPPQRALSPPPDPEIFSNVEPQEPTYNPNYDNDIHLSNRSGKLSRFWYFWNKHCGELAKATGNYLSSHLEFGGCLADYTGLKRRYRALRELEDVNEVAKARTPDNKLMKRVRFVNYYSASTGPPKERSPPPKRELSALEPPPKELLEPSPAQASAASLSVSAASSPRLSLEEHRDGEVISKDLPQPVAAPDSPELTPTSTNSDQATLITTHESILSTETASELQLLPPLPSLPPPPATFDPGPFRSSDVIKLLRKEHGRRVKAYERAVKDREESLKAREKLFEKLFEKQKRHEQKEMDMQVKKSSDSHEESPETVDQQAFVQPSKQEGQEDPRPTKQPKDRKFCTLPPKTSGSEERDSAWIRIHFDGIDEVTAHTSMFNVSETYARMVGVVVERVQSWIAEDASTRMILAEAGS